MTSGRSGDESRPADDSRPVPADAQSSPDDSDRLAADAQGPIAEPTADSVGVAADAEGSADGSSRVAAEASRPDDVTGGSSDRRAGSSPAAAGSPDVADGSSRVAGDGSAAADSPANSRPPAALTAVALGAVIVAALAALWFGGGWVRAALFTDGPRADARDSALDAAQQAALNMTTMNLADVPGSLALARSSMTGPILESATKNQAQSEEMAARAGVGMSSTVLGASITSLNSERDRASALVVLRVTESAPDRPESAYRYTWSLDMAKDGEVWKAEQVASLTQPVLLDGPGPAGTPAEPGAPVEVPPPAEPAPQEGPR